jgi:DNA-binding NarL/FixJ family response regulator
MSISLILYDDDDPLRETIASMLTIDGRYTVVGSFDSVLSVREQVAELKPDIIMMDIDMPGRTGIAAVTEIRSQGLVIPIIMLTVFDDSQTVFEAIRAGASGYLLKKHLSTKLFDALDEILQGGAPMSPAVAHMVIASMQAPANSNPYQLTRREQEILVSLAGGNSYKMMADQFKVTIDTVRAHIKKVYQKMHVRSQTEAVSKALKEKLV